MFCIETSLSDHDLAVPIPYCPRSDPAPPNGPQQRWLRCIILTPSMIQPAGALQDTIKLLKRFRYISGGVDAVVLFFLSPDIIEQQEGGNDVTYLSTKPAEGDMMFRSIHALSVLTTHVKMSHDDDLNVLNILPFGAKEALPGLLSSCTRGILSGDLQKLRKWQRKKKILPIPPDPIALLPPKTLFAVQQAGKIPFPASQAAPLPRNTALEIESDMPLKQQVATAPAQAVMSTHSPPGLPPAQVRIGPQPPSAIPKHTTQRPPPPPILKNPPMPKYNPLPKGWQGMLPALPAQPGNLHTSRLTPPLPPSPPPQREPPNIAGEDQDFKQCEPRKAVEVTVREIHPGQATQTEIGSGHPKQGYEAKPATKPTSSAYDPYGTSPVSAVMDLLPYCTTQTKLLGRAEVISFSDVAGSFREVVSLALGASGVEDEEMGGLEGALGPDGAKGVREFWRNEWVVD